MKTEPTMITNGCPTCSATLAKKAEREQRDAEQREQQQREAAEMKAKVESLRAEQVWALGGFYIEQMSEAAYTLEELEAWAESYGCVFGGNFGGSPQGFNAVCPTLDLSIVLYRHFDIDGKQRFQFERAAKHLREWVAERRLR